MSNFDLLWKIKISGMWRNCKVFATTKNEILPGHRSEYKHPIKSGTRVRVWMVSRFGDVGITSNLIDPIGYDIRGVDPDTNLSHIEIIQNNDQCN